MKKLSAGVLMLSVFVLTAARADAPAPAKPPGIEDAQVAQLKDAKWTAPKQAEIPAGVMASPIAADPASGQSLAYAKFPAGYHMPTHWHSFAESTVVVTGTGKVVIDGKSTDFVAGSYFLAPAKVKHELFCNAGADCVVVTRRAGATDYHFEK